MYSFNNINYYIFDFINLIILVIFFSLIIIYFNKKKIIINKNLFFNKTIQKEILFISALLIIPFFINNFIIEWTYFPDQSKYLNATKIVRDLKIPSNDYMGVFSSSLLFGLFPIPFIKSFTSIGLINKFIFLFIIYFVYKKNFFSKYETFILLFIPTLTVYTSVALKESVIYFFSFIIFYLIKRNFLLLLFPCFCILYFISKKFFIIAFPITLLFIIFFHMLDKKEIKLKFYIFFLILLIIAIIFSIFDSHIYNYINKAKQGYWIEQVRSGNQILFYDGYERFSYKIFFSNIFYFFYKSTFGFINLSNTINLKNILIFFFYLFEMIGFCFLFIYFINKYFKKVPLEIIYCLIVFFLITSFFGYIFENFNTLSRYKTQILVYLYFLLSSSKKISEK